MLIFCCDTAMQFSFPWWTTHIWTSLSFCLCYAHILKKKKKKKTYTNAHIKKYISLVPGEPISGQPGLCLTRVRKMDCFDLTSFKKKLQPASQTRFTNTLNKAGKSGVVWSGQREVHTLALANNGCCVFCVTLVFAADSFLIQDITFKLATQ